MILIFNLAYCSFKIIIIPFYSLNLSITNNFVDFFIILTSVFRQFSKKRAKNGCAPQNAEISTIKQKFRQKNRRKIFSSKIKNTKVIVFEDSQKGIQSARKAGLKVCNVKNKKSIEIIKLID